MKKISIKLNYNEMDCFITICAQLSKNYVLTDLVRATLLQLYARIANRTQFYFSKHRSISLTVPEGIALCAAIGKITLDVFGSYELSVIAPIYQTVQQQIA